jgi:hypothetical protein
MKRIYFLSLLILIGISVVSAQNSKFKNDPVGKWAFEAPYAPEGFTAGIIEVAYAEKLLTASMMFTGTEYKFSGERVKFESDTLSFNILIQDQDVAVKLKFDSKEKMSGKAVYTEGEVPLSLTREIKK